MKLSRRHRHSPRHEQGYVLLTLLLLVTLLIIAAAAAMPAISFEIRRDREEEMVHRGAQYARAIRAYYKKFGRYPAKIEDLESTNNLRFLRKRYKDPMNCSAGKCADFKLLHFGEVKMTLGGALPGIPGATPAGGLNGSGGVGSVLNSGAGNGGLLNSNAANPNNPAQAGENTTIDSTDPSQPGQPVSQMAGTTDSSKDPLSAQVFGGAPIVGVVSLNKKEGIREFNHKKKYNEWQFFYDPTTDRGGLISTPNQQLMTFNTPNLNGQINPNSANPGQQPFGQSPGMNNGPGFGNQNGNQSGFGSPGPPTNQQPQQPQQ